MAGLQYMPTQFIAGDMDLNDARMEQAVAATEEYYGRLNYPQALQYYIGGDVCLRPGTKPHVLKQWNEFLQARYGSAEVLKQAWARIRSPSRSPKKPCPRMTGDWADRRAIDFSDFPAPARREIYQAGGRGGAQGGAPGGADHRVSLDAELARPERLRSDAWSGQQMLDVSNVINAAYRLGVATATSIPI